MRVYISSTYQCSLLSRLEAKDAAAQAIVGLNGSEVGGFMVRCSWGKESNDGPRPQGGAGGYGGYQQQQQGYYPQVCTIEICMIERLCSIHSMSDLCREPRLSARIPLLGLLVVGTETVFTFDQIIIMLCPSIFPLIILILFV